MMKIDNFINKCIFVFIFFFLIINFFTEEFLQDLTDLRNIFIRFSSDDVFIIRVCIQQIIEPMN